MIAAGQVRRSAPQLDEHKQFAPKPSGTILLSKQNAFGVLFGE
jgi:hypothetical protein